MTSNGNCKNVGKILVMMKNDDENDE